jgi:mono/diheme cytochrome c family protein
MDPTGRFPGKLIMRSALLSGRRGIVRIRYLGVATLLVGVLFACGDPEAVPPEPPGSRFTGPAQVGSESGPVWALDEAIYTTSQAASGEEVFRGVCSFCHLLDDFTGTRFHVMWTGSTVGELFAFISSAMPQDNPGGLQDEQYAAVLAYLLRLNGLPAGDQELGTEVPLLRQYRLTRRSNPIHRREDG